MKEVFKIVDVSLADPNKSIYVKYINGEISKNALEFVSSEAADKSMGVLTATVGDWVETATRISVVKGAKKGFSVGMGVGVLLTMTALVGTSVFLTYRDVKRDESHPNIKVKGK